MTRTRVYWAIIVGAALAWAAILLALRAIMAA